MPSTRGATLITGASALVGEELAPLNDRAVVIRDGTIASIGSREAVPAAPDATIVDGTGMTLVPGFIDAHVHIGFVSPSAVVTRGVTTVRDLGWPPEIIWPLAAKSREDDFAGPTVHAVGPILTAPGGYPSRAAWAPRGTALEVDDPQSARTAVDDVQHDGATSVKVALNPPVGPVLDGQTLMAITDRAHDHDLKVSAHVHGLDQLHAALDANVDELAHMFLGPDKIPDGTIERMVAAPMAVVPTLSIRFGLDRRRAIDNLRRFAEAGGTVVYGTDLGNSGPGPGIDRREVTGMAKAGMTPAAIIAAATTGAARWLGFKDVGVLEAGARADVVALGGRPLESARDLTDVRMVWRAGRRVR